MPALGSFLSDFYSVGGLFFARYGVFPVLVAAGPCWLVHVGGTWRGKVGKDAGGPSQSDPCRWAFSRCRSISKESLAVCMGRFSARGIGELFGQKSNEIEAASDTKGSKLSSGMNV